MTETICDKPTYFIKAAAVSRMVGMSSVGQAGGQLQEERERMLQVNMHTNTCTHGTKSSTYMQGFIVEGNYRYMYVMSVTYALYAKSQLISSTCVCMREKASKNFQMKLLEFQHDWLMQGSGSVCLTFYYNVPTLVS